MRLSLIRPARLVLRAGSFRAATFTTSARVLAEGDTGAMRPGAPDAFQKREKSNEDYEIRRREMAKLLELKKKIQQQQKHLEQLSEHIEELTKEQGGEKN